MDLLPGGGDAFTILDTRTFVCDFRASEEIDDPPVIDDPPSDQNTTGVCGCWNFACWEFTDDVTIWDSLCFVIPFIVGVVCLSIFALALFFYVGTRYKITQRQAASRADLQDKIDDLRGNMNIKDPPPGDGVEVTTATATAPGVKTT